MKQLQVCGWNKDLDWKRNLAHPSRLLKNKSTICLEGGQDLGDEVLKLEIF